MNDVTFKGALKCLLAWTTILSFFIFWMGATTLSLWLTSLMFNFIIHQPHFLIRIILFGGGLILSIFLILAFLMVSLGSIMALAEWFVKKEWMDK